MIRVTPRASTPGIGGTRDGALLIRVRSAPVEGAANLELIDVIAAAFGVAKRDVSIVSGEHSRLKRVVIATINQERFDAILLSIGIDSKQITS